MRVGGGGGQPWPHPLGPNMSLSPLKWNKMLLTSFGLHFAQSAFCFLCESGIMMSGLVPISLSLPGKVAFDIIEPVSLRIFRCPLKPP